MGALPYRDLNPYRRLGLAPTSGSSTAGAAAAPLALSGGPSRDDIAPPWSPDNPLFWFAGILLVTVGLAAGATSVRLGPLRASVSAGKES